MLIELTYACKMNCSHCMSDCKPDGINMSKEILRDTLEFFKRYRIPNLVFSGGEMFEHPKILDLLEIVQSYWDKKFPLTFITNGRELVHNREIYDYVTDMQKKYSKKNILIQVTDDERYYPEQLSDKDKYYLKKLNAIIEEVPGLYPQGRVLENFPDSEWCTKGPKCVNCRLLTMQGVNTVNGLVTTLLSANKMCTPVIAPDGSIKIGESALCPSVASIYDSEEDIIDGIKNCKCMKCKIPFDILQENNPIAYKMLKGGIKCIHLV